MNIKSIIIASFLFIISQGINAQTNFVDSLFNEANQSYKAQNYLEAKDQYKIIVDTGYKSAELFFNLGNAYYKNQDYPKAILFYEKALLLSPRDEDVLFNLKKAKAFTIDQIEVIPEFFLIEWSRRFISLLPSNIWSIISLAGFIFALVLFLMFFTYNSRQSKVRAFSMGILFLVVFCISALFAIKTHSYIEKSDQAIIMQSTVTVKGSPDIDGVNVFIIHEGTKVTSLRKIGEWTEIRLDDGKQGWVQQSIMEWI